MREGKNKMPKLKFYDVSKKKSLTTDKFELRTKNTSRGKRYFAIAINSSGNEVWRIVSEAFYKANK